MAKIVIECDDREIWEDKPYDFDFASLTKKQQSDTLKALDYYCKNSPLEDLDYYFIVIDDDNVEIIPASKYNKAPA